MNEVSHTCIPVLWRQTGRFLLARNMSLLDELQARRKPCLPQKEGRWHLRNDARGPSLVSTQTSVHRARAHTKKMKGKKKKIFHNGKPARIGWYGTWVVGQRLRKTG